MSNPFEGTLRGLGIPMLSDRPGHGMGQGRSRFRHAGRVADELARAEEALRRKVHGPAPQPKTSPAVAAALRAPIPGGASRLPEPFRERVDVPKGVDIFIGGGWDDLWGPRRGFGVMHDYAKQYEEQTGGPTRYFPNGHVDAVLDAIREGNATGGPVNIIGHSYGGPDAYNAAARARREGLKVNYVATLDPVAGPTGRLAGPSGADSWTNVYAAPSRPNLSDWITNSRFFSRKPSQLPTDEADRRVAVDANHEDALAMMRAGGVRQRLDESRRVDLGRERQDFRDDLDTASWMRWRNDMVTPPGGWR